MNCMDISGEVMDRSVTRSYIGADTIMLATTRCFPPSIAITEFFVKSRAMSFREFLHESGQAARANLVPGLILQVVAASFLAAYYLAPSLQPQFAWIATQKKTLGYAYSAIATGISGGLVPFLYLWLTGRIKKNTVKILLFYVLFWASLGTQIDVFYHIQSALFGEGNDRATIISKVAVDQIVLTPFWTIPQTTLCYLWKNLDFNSGALRARLNRRLFLHDIPGMTVPGWLVWLPAVSIIYCLPTLLQIPMFSLVQCFWSLLAEVVNTRQNRPAKT